MYIIMRS